LDKEITLGRFSNSIIRIKRNALLLGINHNFLRCWTNK